MLAKLKFWLSGGRSERREELQLRPRELTCIRVHLPASAFISDTEHDKIDDITCSSTAGSCAV